MKSAKARKKKGTKRIASPGKEEKGARRARTRRKQKKEHENKIKLSLLFLSSAHHLRPPHLAQHVEHPRLENGVDRLDRDARAGLFFCSSGFLCEGKNEVEFVFPPEWRSRFSFALFSSSNEKPSHLGHRKHVGDADGVVVDELSQHQSHDLHGYSRPAC